MRWPAILSVVLVLSGAGLAAVLSSAGHAPSTTDAVEFIAPEPAHSEWPNTSNACLVNEGDVHITDFIRHKGNIIIVSRAGDIWVDGILSTADGADGDTPQIYPPEASIPHYYHLGDSGQDGGDIILLAPQGTIHVRETIRTGDGGDGLSAITRFADHDAKAATVNAPGDQHVYVFGGYGGFGGNIYLGAANVDYEKDLIFPGNGGRGGDAGLEGATIHDEVRAGHGGFGGQAYLLSDQLSRNLVARMNSSTDSEPGYFTGCDHPLPIKPHDELTATVIETPERTCRGGDGGDAWTSGLYASAQRTGWDLTIAGVAIGGNGGWGCPGGDGGDAWTVGLDGMRGPDGEDGGCVPLNGNGAPGITGEAGGFGGHAFGGDGGAGMPGQYLTGSKGPNPLYWFYHWGPPKQPEYHSASNFPVTWPHEEGGVADFTVDFPILGDADRYRGGDGGDAMSVGGNGGNGGNGGAGRDGLPAGDGGVGGAGGRGVTASSTFAGWGGPGAWEDGLPGTQDHDDGDDGLRGHDGEDGQTALDC